MIQVVVLASGFDTTAHRLWRPGVSFYEIDLPHALTLKRSLVDRCLLQAAGGAAGGLEGGMAGGAAGGIGGNMEGGVARGVVGGAVGTAAGGVAGDVLPHPGGQPGVLLPARSGSSTSAATTAAAAAAATASRTNPPLMHQDLAPVGDASTIAYPPTGPSQPGSPAASSQLPTYIPADLAAVPLSHALSGSGFDPSQPALFTAQGLLYYLPPSAVYDLLQAVRTVSTPGSTFAFDFLRLPCLSGQRLTCGLEVMRLAVRARGEDFLSGIDDAPSSMAVLAHLFGFRCIELMGAKGLAERYLPHLRWRERPGAPVQPCFAYAELRVEGARFGVEEGAAGLEGPCGSEGCAAGGVDGSSRAGEGKED